MADNKRSPSFRYIYSNAIKLQFNGSELVLTIGIKEDQADPSEIFLEEAGIVLTASSAKLWGHMISRIMESAERMSGQPIPIDDEKLALLDAAIAKTEAAATARAKD